MSSTLVSFEKALSGQLKNTIVLNVIRVVLVIYILMITSIPVSMLRLFENLLFQVFYLSLLAYMALIDPASALLMAAAYLFTVQQLNQTMGMGVSSNNNVVKMMNNNSVMMNNNRENFSGPVANNATMAPALAIASETHSEHPAYQTMTDNLTNAISEAPNISMLKDINVLDVKPGAALANEITTLTKNRAHKEATP